MHHSAPEAVVPIIISLMLLMIVIALAFVALMLAATWKIYVKAGRKGWEGLIPFYNYAVMLELVNEPLWWVALMFVPVANLIVPIVVIHRLSRAFGHGGWFTAGLVFLPVIFWPILGFGNSQYRNAFPPTPPTSSATKWALAAAAGYAFMYCSMLALVSGTFSDPSRLQPLSIIKSDNSDGLSYATDGRYVYINDNLVQGADAESFRIVGDYALDYGQVYYAGTPIAHADPQTFRTGAGEYANDASAAYYAGTPVNGVDVMSFKTLDTEYAADSASVYFDGSRITDADPGSFSVLGSSYAKDRIAVYYLGAVLPGADPSTFRVIDDKSGNLNYDAKDVNHTYLYGETLKK